MEEFDAVLAFLMEGGGKKLSSSTVEGMVPGPIWRRFLMTG
jgi:hypothetical protein